MKKYMSILINGVHIKERMFGGIHILCNAKDIDGEFIFSMGRGKATTITPRWLDYTKGKNIISIDFNNQ